MEREVIESNPVAIRIEGVKKTYRLGQIGGGTLQADLQSWWARKRGKEDPNLKIGQEQRLVGQSFMALNGIDLTIHQGEAVGIIGSNGAGKSTLLKLLSQVTAPTAGTIELYGRVASMLEVGTGFHGEMTGRENIYMNGAILGMSKEEIDSKMENIIEFSEVRDFIDTPVKRYSSGMYVKLAFSVAAHLDSEILIMDEVLAVGDMAFQKKCLAKMREAAKKQGRTVLYVSHNMGTIRKLCDRCIVLDKGKKIFDGEVEKAIQYYLGNNIKNMGTDIDLSQMRMDHLPKNPKAKMQRIVLKHDSTMFEFGEDIKLQLFIKANVDLNHPCVRIEIRTGDDSPAGAGYIHNLDSIAEGQEAAYDLVFRASALVPDTYKVCLVLYQVTDSGLFADIDAIYPAFTFDVVNTYGKLKINWNNRLWGSVVFSVEEARRNC